MIEEQRKKFEEILFTIGKAHFPDTKMTLEKTVEGMKSPEGKFVLALLKASYNRALEDAANPSYIFEPQVYNPSFHASQDKRVVYRETILSLKIEL